MGVFVQGIGINTGGLGCICARHWNKHKGWGWGVGCICARQWNKHKGWGVFVQSNGINTRLDARQCKALGKHIGVLG